MKNVFERKAGISVWQVLSVAVDESQTVAEFMRLKSHERRSFPHANGVFVFHRPLKHPQRRLYAMSFFGTTTSTTPATSDKDIEVADPPPDSISSLGFSPQADYLAVGSWDNNVRGPMAIAI